QRPRLAALLVGVLALSSLSPAPLAGATPNEGPLDPLTAAEIATAVQVIEASPKYPAGAFFPIVTLKEPPKSELVAWAPGQPFRREALANVYERTTTPLVECDA